MKAPGVTVRPLRQMSGGADFNEVFFDDVVVPDTERLGDVGDGWRVALTTLMSERLSLGGGGTDIGVSAATGGRARRRAPRGPARGPRRPWSRQQLGRAYVDALAIRYTGYRLLSAISRGELPGPEASAGKLAGTQVARDLADLAVRVLGDDAAYAATADGGTQLAGRAGRAARHGHRRRHQRGAAQRHRRAGPRPARRAARRQGHHLQGEPRVPRA